ncbi:MAG: hypothetical protein ACT4N2_10190 [Hyphomicrobium sp.]
MSTCDQIRLEAARLSDEKQAATLAFMRALTRRSFFETAPPEALVALERGLAEIENGQTIGGDELFKSVDQQLKQLGV